MSGRTVCRCVPGNWRVLTYRGNYSAFNGYHFTPSDYSAICCLFCGKVWRTKASYVYGLEHITPEENTIRLRGDSLEHVENNTPANSSDHDQKTRSRKKAV